MFKSLFRARNEMGMRHRDFSTIEWESNMGQIWVQHRWTQLIAPVVVPIGFRSTLTLHKPIKTGTSQLQSIKIREKYNRVTPGNGG